MENISLHSRGGLWLWMRWTPKSTLKVLDLEDVLKRLLLKWYIYSYGEILSYKSFKSMLDTEWSGWVFAKGEFRHTVQSLVFLLRFPWMESIMSFYSLFVSQVICRWPTSQRMGCNSYNHREWLMWLYMWTICLSLGSWRDSWASFFDQHQNMLRCCCSIKSQGYGWRWVYYCCPELCLSER